MIAVIHLLAADPGSHAVAHAAPLAVLPALFRRLRHRREPSSPGACLSASGAGGLTVAQQLDHADAMHEAAKPYLPDPPRPVNGRSLGTLPRLSTPDAPPWDVPTAAQPVYNEACQLDVAAAEMKAAAEHAANVRAFMPHMSLPDAGTLARVRDAIRNLGDDRPDATYRGGWQ